LPLGHAAERNHVRLIILNCLKLLVALALARQKAQGTSGDGTVTQPRPVRPRKSAMHMPAEKIDGTPVTTAHTHCCRPCNAGRCGSSALEVVPSPFRARYRCSWNRRPFVTLCMSDMSHAYRLRRLSSPLPRSRVRVCATVCSCPPAALKRPYVMQVFARSYSESATASRHARRAAAESALRQQTSV
jgi:hypothetical protein